MSILCYTYVCLTFVYYRTGAERSCLYCAVSVLIEKMEIEHEVSVVNTLRQIKARRLSAISSVVGINEHIARVIFDSINKCLSF